jgi:N6-L-threonylcarbamoyladenine synthase
VNHLRGHVWSAFLPVHAAAPADFAARAAELLPHLGLVVSGGNTLLFTLDRERRVTVLASTRDDAAGEALDKGAKLLGLGYPGGPLIERAARTGRRDAFDFPRGLGARSDLGFSFSGLKTSLRYRIEKMTPAEVARDMPDLCASYQEAVVAALERKTGLALDQGGGAFRSLGLSGGVANNGPLRDRLAALAKRERVAFLPSRPEHTGDNAGMIAFAAWADPACRPSESLQVVPGREPIGPISPLGPIGPRFTFLPLRQGRRPAGQFPENLRYESTISGHWLALASLVNGTFRVVA